MPSFASAAMRHCSFGGALEDIARHVFRDIYHL